MAEKTGWSEDKRSRIRKLTKELQEETHKKDPDENRMRELASRLFSEVRTNRSAEE